MSELSTVCAVLAAGATSAIVDLQTRRVPNPLTLPLGTLVELDADERVLSVLEPAVR